MSEFVFKKAKRTQARLRTGIAGVSGSGKTMGALRVAKGLVDRMIAMGIIEGPVEGKIALIDSERRSAQLYAHVVPFDTLELVPPYSVDRYQQALLAAEQAGYVVCIIDQISHAWAGPGGQLEWIDTLKQNAKNAMSPWSKVTPVQQEFYDRMLRSPMHLILTMRSKSEWVIEDVVENGRTKKVPRKIGLSPVQREGIEYEMTTMLDVDLETHMASSSKDRTGLFDGRQVRLDEEVGRQLADWLLSGDVAEPEEAVVPARERVVSVTTDFISAFDSAVTLDDLKEMFGKAEVVIKGYKEAVGAPIVNAQLQRLISAKDKNKERIKSKKPIEETGGPDLLNGNPSADDALVSEEQAAALLAKANDVGLSEDEALKALSVDGFSQVKASTFDAALGLLDLAAKQGKKRKAPRAE